MPTEVSGSSGTKVTFSGIAIFEMIAAFDVRGDVQADVVLADLAGVVRMKHDQRDAAVSPHLTSFIGITAARRTPGLLHDDVFQHD